MIRFATPGSVGLWVALLLGSSGCSPKSGNATPENGGSGSTNAGTGASDGFGGTTPSSGGATGGGGADTASGGTGTGTGGATGNGGDVNAGGANSGGGTKAGNGGTNSGGTSSGGTNSGGTNSGGTSSGGTNSGGTNSCGSGGVLAFDDGADSLNDVTAGSVCARIAQIQCAAQEHCCSQCHSTKDACIQTQTKGCVDGGLDYVTLQSRDAFDSANAGTTIRAFEAKAEACDPGVAVWASTPDGLVGLVKGTFADAADCSPPAFTTDVKTLASFLASCTNAGTESCLPHTNGLTPAWKCTPVSGLGANCFTDLNCNQTADVHGVYCNNDVNSPTISDSWQCKPRGQVGDSCASGNQCQTLLCTHGATTQHPGTCLDASVDNAYCIN